MSQPTRRIHLVFVPARRPALERRARGWAQRSSRVWMRSSSTGQLLVGAGLVPWCRHGTQLHSVSYRRGWRARVRENGVELLPAYGPTSVRPRCSTCPTMFDKPSIPDRKATLPVCSDIVKRHPRFFQGTKRSPSRRGRCQPVGRWRRCGARSDLKNFAAR